MQDETAGLLLRITKDDRFIDLENHPDYGFMFHMTDGNYTSKTIEDAVQFAAEKLGFVTPSGTEIARKSVTLADLAKEK